MSGRHVTDRDEIEQNGTNTQATLSGEVVEVPDCDEHGCDRDATTLYVLRGMSVNKVVRCDQHEPYWQGSGGIDNVVELNAQVVGDYDLSREHTDYEEVSD
ncbi:hypothetical protein [Natronocalculus amylovorans]|uniref:Uncharacterized protein n=1 Tax=Natronocalculus amylovorans TaxID=2917812 RepID=A0AAE3K9I1_9EURY|nr:hypothetical protein [Natronocalculus amylovorans]MCL9818367.1 hypothetical protein [Natronocalculus amylovorans]